MNGLDFASSGGLRLRVGLRFRLRVGLGGLDFASTLALSHLLCLRLPCNWQFGEFFVQIDVFFGMPTDLFLACQLIFFSQSLLLLSHPTCTLHSLSTCGLGVDFASSGSLDFASAQGLDFASTRPLIHCILGHCSIIFCYSFFFTSLLTFV